MATQVLADQELEALRKFPEIGREELFRFFTLTRRTLRSSIPSVAGGPADRLGLAVTLCTLPWIGFVPDEVAAAPRAAVARLAEQLQVDPDHIRSRTGGGRRPVISPRRRNAARVEPEPSPCSPFSRSTFWTEL